MTNLFRTYMARIENGSTGQIGMPTLTAGSSMAATSHPTVANRPFPTSTTYDRIAAPAINVSTGFNSLTGEATSASTSTQTDENDMIPWKRDGTFYLATILGRTHTGRTILLCTARNDTHAATVFMVEWTKSVRPTLHR